MANITGTAGDDDLKGNSGKDTIRGLDGHDTLAGRNGSDIIFGGKGDDEIIGGRGDDILYGNDGADIFKYQDQLDSRTGNPDKIMDFAKNVDSLDLQGVDADLKNAGDQAFNLVTTFGNNPGELTIGNGKVEGDLDGNATPDFVILFESQIPDLGDFLW